MNFEIVEKALALALSKEASVSFGIDENGIVNTITFKKDIIPGTPLTPGNGGTGK